MRMALPWKMGEFECANASMASATMAAFTRTVVVDQAMSAGRGGAEAAAGLGGGAAGSLTAASVFGTSVMACIVVVQPAIDIAIPAVGVAVATDSAPAASRSMAAMPRLTYPTPPTSDQVDDLHGTAVADPYRPLEDSDAPESRAWIAAENALTEQVLSEVPGRNAIRERLAALWDYPRAGAPWRRGDRWFQLRNTGLQDQDVLWTADAADAEGLVLIDPNRLSEDGTTALSSVAVSESGELVALATSDAGSDWRSWTVRRASAGEELPD